MSAPLGRALMRKPFASRLFARNASTSQQATKAAEQGAEKAGAAAGNATSKASEGLTRVASSAGPTISNAANAANNALSKVGGRTGRVIALVQSMIPPTVYYGKVGLELAKLVAKNRKMSLPDVATFQSHFQPILNTVRSPSSLLNSASSTASNAANQAAHAATTMSPQSLLSRVRNMDNQQLINASIVGAEVIGFFTVGQMIGRFKVVGYRTSGHAHGGEH